MLITSAVMLNLSGCWDSRELNTIGIVSGVGLDKATTPDDIEMTVQIANVSGEQQSSSMMSSQSSSNGTASTGGSNFFNAKDTGPDVLSILHKLTHAYSRKLYFSHNDLIILGEDLAKEGVRDSLDFFARSYEPRLTAYIFVAKGKAADVFDVQPNFEKITAAEITMLMNDPVGSIDKNVVQVSDLLVGLISETTSAVAPMIEVKEQSGKKQIYVSGLAVFKKDKLVGELSAMESRGYKWVKSNIEYSALKVDIEGETAEIIVTSSKGKITPQINDDGSVKIKVEITAEGSLDSQTGTVNLAELKNAKLLKKATESVIKKEVETTINKTRELDADIFGFRR